MNLSHLTSTELEIWNTLDKAVGRFLKDPKRHDPNIGNFDAQTAAALRDRIGDERTSTTSRAQFVREAQEALRTDEWWHSSVNGSGGGDEG